MAAGCTCCRHEGGRGGRTALPFRVAHAILAIATIQTKARLTVGQGFQFTLRVGLAHVGDAAIKHNRAVLSGVALPALCSTRHRCPDTFRGSVVRIVSYSTTLLVRVVDGRLWE